MMKLLVTGSSGLIGSEVVTYFSNLGWEVHGVDNNMRADFFGPQGDTRWNQERLKAQFKSFHHHELDIRDRKTVLGCLDTLKPDMVVHTAAQPSHDLAASRPFADFDTNAVGTLNMLEATRLSVPESVFIHMSTNKVYGDRPNTIKLKELATRWDYDDPTYENGITEEFSIDQSKHSLFGASKVAADVLVQEYGREPSPEEISDEIQLPVERVRAVLKMAQQPISLQAPVGDSDDTSFGDFIEDKGAENPADMAAIVLLKDKIKDVLESLTERERQVLEQRFGLVDGYSRTLEEVGRQFKVTRERIRQIEAKALRKMRHPTRIRQLEGFLDAHET